MKCSLVVFELLILAAPAVTLAAKPQASKSHEVLRLYEKIVSVHQKLEQLQVGQKIEVIDMNLKSLKGTLTAVSEEAISLRTKQGELSVERANVFRLSDREHTRRGNRWRCRRRFGCASGRDLQE